MRLANARQCHYCPAMIAMLETNKGSFTPIDPDPVVRDGSAPLPKGKYFSEKMGECFDQDDAPCKVQLHRSHFGDCPGAKEEKGK